MENLKTIIKKRYFLYIGDNNKYVDYGDFLSIKKDQDCFIITLAKYKHTKVDYVTYMCDTFKVSTRYEIQN